MSRATKAEKAAREMRFRETPVDRTERARAEAARVTPVIERFNGAGQLDADVDLVKLMRAPRSGLTRRLRKLRANLKRAANTDVVDDYPAKVAAAKAAKKKAPPAPVLPFPQVAA